MTEADSTPEEREYRREVNTNCFREIFAVCEAEENSMYDGTHLLPHASIALKNGATWEELGPRDQFLKHLIASVNAQIANAEENPGGKSFMELVWLPVVLSCEPEIYREIEPQLSRPVEGIYEMLESYEE